METPSNPVHAELRALQKRLQTIYDSIELLRPGAMRLPILDSSLEISNENGGAGSLDDPWIHQDRISGLTNLRHTIKIDLDVLEKFLLNPQSANLPPLSTNAPYLIAVWNELVCAPGRVVAVFKSFDLYSRVNSHLSKEERKEEEKKAISSGQGKEAYTKVKVDVVAERGMRWIRVNTIKNARILSEFREFDSYLTDESDSEEEYEHGPTLAQTELDNSVLKMGRSLIQAASTNPVNGAVPKVTLRLTRLDPDEPDVDPRIAQTVDSLRAMGIEVELGERSGVIDLPPAPPTPDPTAASYFSLTTKINLDLSILIALVSDSTHSSLPASTEEAYSRFFPQPSRLREWRLLSGKGDSDDQLQHSRQLINQVMQETVKGMLQEMKERITFPSASASSPSTIEFYTTEEARERCLRIVDKIGGPNEQRRTRALFAADEAAYWSGSRYEQNYLPLMPLRYHSDASACDRTDGLSFFRTLEKTCEDILKAEEKATIQDAGHVQDDEDEDDSTVKPASNVLRTKRLTAHTVRSLLWGARKGWTTITANRTSIKAVLSEINARRASDVAGAYEYGQERAENAAIWIVDPRSLAEAMRSEDVEGGA